MRTLEELNAIISQLPESHRRFCMTTGDCGCMGCVNSIRRLPDGTLRIEPITREEFDLWQLDKENINLLS